MKSNAKCINWGGLGVLALCTAPFNAFPTLGTQTEVHSRKSNTFILQ